MQSTSEKGERSLVIFLLTLIPNDCILEATSFPILPSPTIPSTLPYSSAPMNCKIRNKMMTLPTRFKSAQLTHLIIADWVNNGVDHATVMVLCANCKYRHSNSTRGEPKCYLFPVPVALFHRHCSLRHISEKRLTY